MSSIVFKRLFEVQFLHEYYLMDENNTSYFDLAAAPKASLLSRRLKHKILDIHNELDIAPTTKTEALLKNYRLKWARTALGFIVGTEVKTRMSGSDLFYAPQIDWDADEALCFTFAAKNSYFKSITNTTLNRPFPSNFYFSTKDLTPFSGDLVLSNPIAPFDASFTYEMGAFADFSGTIKEAIETTNASSAALWNNRTDHRFVNNADQRLLPHKFRYHFHYDNAILQADFVLKETDGTVVKSIQKVQTDPIQSVYLNFSAIEDVIESPTLIESGEYLLDVSTDTGIAQTYSIRLDTEYHDIQQLGLLDLSLSPTDPNFAILDGNGELQTRRVGGILIPHPIYEIRFASRKPYWRYIPQTTFTPAEITAGTAFHLTQDGDNLVSNDPKTMSHSLVPFSNGDIFPMPQKNSIRYQNNKVFADIPISSNNPLVNI